MPEDEALVHARQSGGATTMPQAEVAANQGKPLALLCGMSGARRVLEFGTPAGYSTIWPARAVGADGRLEATALQTVGSKGWDGFTVVRRTR